MHPRNRLVPFYQQILQVARELKVSIRQEVSNRMDGPAPIMQRIEKRVGASGDDFPWYVGLEDPHSVNGGVVFSVDFHITPSALGVVKREPFGSITTRPEILLLPPSRMKMDVAFTRRK
jgi:hypothetical protein